MNLPRCQLYLRVPDGVKVGTARACLTAALEAGDVAALLVPHKGREGDSDMVETLLPLAQGRGVAVLLAGDDALARRLSADGVEVSDRAGYDAARKRLGSAAIVGADCASSRHFAMEIAEAGADYVGFANAAAGGAELVGWWSEVFEIPCVALDPADPERAGELARLGADFVRPADAMWDGPDAARAVITETLEALDGAAR